MKLLSKLAVMVLLLLPACAGLHARQDVLLPAMQIAYESIRPDVLAGIDLQPQEQVKFLLVLETDFYAALSAGDIDALLVVRWQDLEIVALEAIDSRLRAGKIGPAVAKLLVMQLDKFREAYVKLVTA